MLQTVVVSSLSQAVDLFFDGWYNHTIDRYRSDYAFRGVHSAEYSLVSSFSRNCSDQWDLEHNILRNFSKYAEMEAPFMVQSVWKQMILGQHYGLPTRLLDWTYSPLIALHFATNDADLDCLANNDAAVWKVHVDDVHGQLPEEYKRKLSEETAHVFTVDMLNDITPNLKKYDSDMENSTFVFLEPPSIDARIVNQFALFSVIPRCQTQLENCLSRPEIRATCYIIPRELKWEIRDKLDHSNITERILFPGLGGLATWLRRHYYVKEHNNNDKFDSN